MPILTRDEAQALMKKVIGYSKADEIEVNLSGSDGGNIRYARNAVSTSGGISQSTLVVQSSFGKKVGVATINEFDDASLEKVVRRSEELARLAPENPEFVKNLGPQQYVTASPNQFVEKTAALSPKERADAVAQSLAYNSSHNISKEIDHGGLGRN